MISAQAFTHALKASDKAGRITPPHVPRLLEKRKLRRIHSQGPSGRPVLSAGRLGDQYSHRAACLLAPTAGSLKSRRAAFFPSQSLLVFSNYIRRGAFCQGKLLAGPAHPDPKTRLHTINLILVRCWEHIQDYCERLKAAKEAAAGTGGVPFPGAGSSGSSSATAAGCAKTHEDAEAGNDEEVPPGGAGGECFAKAGRSPCRIAAQGVREIKTAFDMDYVTNCYVQSAYDKLMTLLGFRYGTYAAIQGAGRFYLDPAESKSG